MRSDQYSFVRQGVPAMFLVPGFNSSDPASTARRCSASSSTRTITSRPTTWRVPVDAPSVERFTRANVALGYLIAEDAAAPHVEAGQLLRHDVRKSE